MESRIRLGRGVVLLVLGAAVGCGDSSKPAVIGPEARVVAQTDGTVDLQLEGRTLFALAAGGPIARTFVEETSSRGPIDVTGLVFFERTQESADPLAVAAVQSTGAGARVEYASADGGRTAVLTAEPGAERTEFRLETFGSPSDSIAIGIRCDEKGSFHGFGEQYNATDQRGEVFPLLVNEQGNGRTGATDGIAIGDAHTTYFPMPYYLDARGFGVLFHTARRVDVDLCASDPARAWIEVVGETVVRWSVFHGPTPLDAIRQLSEVVGRPALPPPWAHLLWVGAQGGREALLAEVDALEAARIPVGALWVQDWGGARRNFDGGLGVQYVWEPLEECPPSQAPDDPAGVCYPDFAELVSGLHERGYKFLAYLNPFIVADEDERYRPRFEEMESQDLLLRGADGEVFVDPLPPNAPQRSAQPDFSNPATLAFVKRALRRIVTDYGVDGWMADFGEWSPVDGRPFDGSDPVERRNTFPIDWQRATRETMEEIRPDGDWVMFARSGFTGVQGAAQIHWAGDQETNWGEADGLPTVVPALLNLGLAGQPYVTHDVAGFAKGGRGPSTKELFLRWTELGAFTPIMRTHEGADRFRNWSWESDGETTAHFRRFAFVHCALRGDFEALAKEAQQTSAPILRHTMLVFPDDPETWDLSDQYVIGDSLLVAPVTAEGATSRSLYLPAGTWYDVWTGARLDGGRRVLVEAPIGRPPVFSRGADRDDLRTAETRLRLEDCRLPPIAP